MNWAPLRRLALLVIVAITLGAAPVAAQEAPSTPSAEPSPAPVQAFEIYPKGQMLGDYFAPTIEAGKKAELVVVLANTGTVPFKGRTYAINAHTAVNGGFTVADTGEAPSGPTLWLDYPEAVYDIGPGKGIERTFTVMVPKGTEPGQYLTALILENAEPQAVAGSGGDSNFNQIVRFPVPVFITVPGPVEPGFQIGDPTLGGTEAASELDIPIVNTGNVKVRPEGTVAILDPSGKELYNVPVKMNSVFAHDQTKLVIGLPSVLPAGDYQVKVDLSDPETKATAHTAVTVTAAAPVATTPVPVAPVQIVSATGTPMPDAEHVQFLNVSVVIDNAGDPLTNGQVVLRVAHDGQPVEDFPVAASLALPVGQTTVQSRYIPATGWSKGAWTFEVIVEAVAPGTGVAQVLATTTLESLQVAK